MTCGRELVLYPGTDFLIDFVALSFMWDSKCRTNPFFRRNVWSQYPHRNVSAGKCGLWKAVLFCVVLRCVGWPREPLDGAWCRRIGREGVGAKVGVGLFIAAIYAGHTGNR